MRIKLQKRYGNKNTVVVTNNENWRLGGGRFLDASSHLYNRLCPSVGLSVCNAFVKITEKQQIHVFHMITAVGKRIESESDVFILKTPVYLVMNLRR